MEIKRGDIYMAQLGDHPDGSIQAGYRPVIVCSNNMANRYSTVITVIPLTTQRKKKLPTHACLEGCGLPQKFSIALCEQILSLNKIKLQKRIGTIRNTIYEEQIKKAIAIQLDL